MSKLQEFCKKGLNNMTRLTLNEAIAHAREVAEKQRKDNNNCKYKKQYGCKGCAEYYSKPCIECAREHEQLAEWLEELKTYKEKEFDVLRQDGQLLYKQGIIDGYNKAIDDLLEDANEMAIEVDTGTYTMKAIGIGLLEQIAEQLKEGGTDE